MLLLPAGGCSRLQHGRPVRPSASASVIFLTDQVRSQERTSGPCGSIPTSCRRHGGRWVSTLRGPRAADNPCFRLSFPSRQLRGFTGPNGVPFAAIANVCPVRLGGGIRGGGDTLQLPSPGTYSTFAPPAPPFFPPLFLPFWQPGVLLMVSDQSCMGQGDTHVSLRWRPTTDNNRYPSSSSSTFVLRRIRLRGTILLLSAASGVSLWVLAGMQGLVAQ